LATGYVQKLFLGKCSYTEVRSETLRFHLHRPESDAYDPRLGSSAEHYWWFALWDGNWMLASAEVASLKRENFPLIGERAALPADLDNPLWQPAVGDLDHGVLLDPCSDLPWWHLHFDRDGTVRPWSDLAPPWLNTDTVRRGPETIRLLDLNADYLVRSRASAIATAIAQLEANKFHVSPELIDDGLEHVGAIRQAVTMALVTGGHEVPGTLAAELAPLVVLEPSAFSNHDLDMVAAHVEVAASDQLDRLRQRHPLTTSDPEPDRAEPEHAAAPNRPPQAGPEPEHAEPEHAEPEHAEPEHAAEPNRPPQAGPEPDAAFAPDGSTPAPPPPSPAPPANDGTHPGPGPQGSAGQATEGAAPAAAADRAGTAAATVIPRTAVIRRVVIKNFQPIKSAEFTIPVMDADLTKPLGAPDDSTSKGRRWKALLGENGAGKSAALRAIGLALSTGTLADLEARGLVDWSKMLRRGERQGRVLLEFSDSSRIDLRFNADRGWFFGGAPQFDGFVRGFGATRLVGAPIEPASSAVRLGNLYDPFECVGDAEKWLLSIEDEGDFNVAAVAISELLGLSADPQIPLPASPSSANPNSTGADSLRADTSGPRVVRTGNEITIDGEPFSNASDGYRSTVALACDLLAGSSAGLADHRNANGIVLIDELGTHLHPQWKMDITRKLRSVFPSMQFIVSTHEPLCLLGLVEDEVIRVRAQRDASTGERFAELEAIAVSPSGYRVDRLLTSEFFGLNTTIDPVVDAHFRDYYALLRRDDLTDDELARLRALKALVSQHGVLGYTRRDQLVYEAIDRYLASEPLMDPAQRAEQRRQTLDAVSDIWRDVAARRHLGG
jgi:outer membrane biosynthesis protein TonB